VDQYLVSCPAQKKKEEMEMSKIVLLIAALAWFDQGNVWESMPEWTWPVWGRAGFENIFSRVKTFGEDIV